MDNTIFSVSFLRLDMKLPSCVMVRTIKIRDFGKPRTWIFRQWVEVYSINNDTDALDIVYSQKKLISKYTYPEQETSQRNKYAEP